MGFKIYGVISTTQNLELYISVSIFNVRFWSCEAPPPCYNVPHSLSKIYFCLLVHDSSSFFIHPCPLLSFQFYCFAFWVLLFLCSFLPAFCCVVNVILMLLVVFYLLTVLKLFFWRTEVYILLCGLCWSSAAGLDWF